MSLSFLDFFFPYSIYIIRFHIPFHLSSFGSLKISCTVLTSECVFLQALTNAERKKRYLEKLKTSGNFVVFKQKNAENARKRRNELKNGVEKLPKKDRESIKRKNREYSRRKQNEYRQRKKEAKGIASTSTDVGTMLSVSKNESYKTPSALNKAVAKLKRAAPKTLQKKKDAVAKFLKTFDPEDVQEMVGSSLNKRKGTRNISPSLVSEVTAFYERDDISRMSPNVKHCKKFDDPTTGTKEFKQIRFLMYTLSDVYEKFKKQMRIGEFFLFKWTFKFNVSVISFKFRILYVVLI